MNSREDLEPLQVRIGPRWRLVRTGFSPRKGSLTAYIVSAAILESSCRYARKAQAEQRHRGRFRSLSRDSLCIEEDVVHRKPSSLTSSVAQKDKPINICESRSDKTLEVSEASRTIVHAVQYKRLRRYEGTAEEPSYRDADSVRLREAHEAFAQVEAKELESSSCDFYEIEDSEGGAETEGDVLVGCQGKSIRE